VRRQPQFRFWALLCLAGLFSRCASADDYDPPAGYYSAATGTGATLKSQLNDIVDGHTTRSYDQLRADLQVTDADPNDSARIMTIYNNRVSVAKVTNGSIPGWDGSPSAPWNREHSWAQSRGLEDVNGNNGTSAPDGSDMHHVFPAIPLANSTRNNFNFGGVFGAQGPGLLNDGGTKYYPGDLDAGMVARAQFYMATRYDGTESQTRDLELATGNPAENGTTMGDLNRLIEWHYAAVPDTFERNRNQIIYDTYQHNRNPFIDRPEYAWSIFVDQNNDSQLSIQGGTTLANGSSTRTVNLGRVFVNGAVPAAQSLTLNKTGNDGTYFEVTKSGDATSSLTGRFNAMRTNMTDSKAITVGLSTSTAAAGLKTGAVTIDNLDITTGGGSGHGAGDQNDTFNVSLTVLDHAKASFSSPALATTKTIDFGNIAVGSSPSPANFSVFNLLAASGFSANMDFDSFTPSGNFSAFTTNLAASAGSLSIAAGSSQTFASSFVAMTVGTFTANYVLNFSDENIAGALNSSITLTLTGKTRLPGDYNGDLKVDAADYTTWRKTINQPVAIFSGADGSGNGIVDSLDYDVWRTHFGQTASGSGGGSSIIANAVVPEPASCLLLVAGALACALRCRTR
jgi:endonuclease I